ncbi:MAG TPA: hypothetical protein VLG37_01535 [Candidatus Saccharimonadales bacterium]|nr:hypothetical protein [Candidatus Saccharimonadales bacterium]
MSRTRRQQVDRTTRYTATYGDPERQDDSSYLDQLLRAQSLDEKMHWLLELEQGGPKGCLHAGEACLEIAQTDFAHDPEATLSWLERAATNWRRAVDTSRPNGHRLATPFAFSSLVQLAHLPAYTEQVRTGRLPGKAICQKLYEDLLGIGQAYNEDLNDMRTFTDNPQTETKHQRMANQTASELVTLLLLQRFAWRHLEEGAYMSLPALQSGSRNISTAPQAGTRWDIAIFTDTSPEPCYKLRVHPTIFIQQQLGRTYPEDIHALSIYPDLMTEGEKNVTASKIITECIFEKQTSPPSPRIMTSLDQRTNQLLDIMG